MELTFLGTSSGAPTRSRNVSAAALRLLQRGEIWLFDCGEGTQHQILRSPLSISRVRRIFITHLHGDHVLGLAGLVASMGLAGDAVHVDVYGPAGLRELMETTIRLTDSHPTFHLDIHEIAGGTIFEDEEFGVTSALLRHKIPAYGYRVEEKNRPGRFDAAAAALAAVPPGPVYGRLKRGENVVLPDGRTLRGADFTGPAKVGRKLAYCTDTASCEGAVELARNVDLLIHEATYSREDMARMPDRLHSTPSVAAEVAKRAGAHRLILTHFSPRYATTEALVAEARAIFPETDAADDFMTVELPRGTPQHVRKKPTESTESGN